MNRNERHWQFPTIFLKALLAAATIALIVVAWFAWRWMQPPKPFARIATLGYVESPAQKYYEPFGVAADDDGNIYFTESITGRVFQLAAGSYENNLPLQVSVVAENLETPSAIALDPNGNLIVANTGAHTIVRIDPKTKSVTVVAGQAGVSGDADGTVAEARFNAPVGVAVDKDGTIFVADTYNDRIRVITHEGQVRTLAGGKEPGFADDFATAARFDTPCGIAIAPNAALLVADTGNRRIRQITPNGQVTTVAGNNEFGENDGTPASASFREPIAITVRDKFSFFVADAGGSIRLVSLNPESLSVKTELPKLPLNRPIGLAVLPDGELAFAESGSSMIRALIPAESKLGIQFDPDAIAMSADRLRQLVPPRWPFDPPEAPREIAGTFGEVRGQISPEPESEAWFHNGLDVPGGYGELTRAIFTEPVTLPLAVESVGTTRERIRLPLFGYIHVKIGRDKDDQLLPSLANGAVTFSRNPEGQVSGVRIRRGTVFKAGDPIGSLNRLNHVHLIAGQWGNEFNALKVLKLPGLKDSIPPVIEKIMIQAESGETVFETSSAQEEQKITLYPRRYRLITRAYDQVNGNAKHRRLGVYELDYYLLEDWKMTAIGLIDKYRQIRFDKLPAGLSGAKTIYDKGSQSGYQGKTIFDYIVTNHLNELGLGEGFLDLTAEKQKELNLLVYVRDFEGNQTAREFRLVVLPD